MTSGQRQQSFPTRSGVRRRGDEYQDSVALDLMVDWLEHTNRYQWMQVEADDRGALDDVVALDTRNVLHVWQVKHSAHPDIPEDAYTWDSLLAQSEGRRGRTTQSLLQKWSQSLERVQREYTEVVPVLPAIAAQHLTYRLPCLPMGWSISMPLPMNRCVVPLRRNWAVRCKRGLFLPSSTSA
jgi:hypothetical protein